MRCREPATFVGTHQPQCLTYERWPFFSTKLHPDPRSPYHGIGYYEGTWENACLGSVTIALCIELTQAVVDEARRLPPHLPQSLSGLACTEAGSWAVSTTIEADETVVLDLAPMAEDRLRWTVCEPGFRCADRAPPQGTSRHMPRSASAESV